MIHVGGKTYQILKEHKDAFNEEAFKQRYSEVLDRYDFIVGDWGYNQLRLKGFFREGGNKANRDTTISHLEDYLNEYCNFGCAYFVLEKIGGGHKGGGNHRHREGGGHAAEDSGKRGNAEAAGGKDD